MDIPLVHLVITLDHAGGVSPPVLFGLKKLFPAAFRRAVGCATVTGACGAGPGCPCNATFGQRLTPDPAALRRYQKPPLPFAFQIPATGEGAPWCLTLTLFGEATSQLETYLKALELLFPEQGQGNPWRVRLLRIEAIAGDGVPTVLPRGGRPEFSSLPLLSFEELFSTGLAATDTVTLELLTPLRLLHQGMPLRDLPFSALAGVLFRRVSSLAYYYGGLELPHDFKWLAQLSRGITCRNNRLVWVNRGGGVQGLEGRVTYQGELEEFLPFLALGRRLNLGKGATYGMGCYRLAG
jgi:hypothetical protein